MQSNLPPGVTDATIEQQADWPELEDFCNWLDGDTVPIQIISFDEMKRAWLRGCIEELKLKKRELALRVGLEHHAYKRLEQDVDRLADELRKLI